MFSPQSSTGVPQGSPSARSPAVAFHGYHLAFALAMALLALAFLGGTRQRLAHGGLLTLHYDPLELARDLEGSSQLAKAVGQHRMATLIDPSSEGTWFTLGYLLRKAGDRQGAGLAYGHVLRLNRGRADARVALGEMALDDGHFAEAIVELSAAVALDPLLARAHNGLGFACASMNRLEEAIGHFQKATDLTGDPLIRANLERARFDLRARDEAARAETP